MSSVLIDQGWFEGKTIVYLLSGERNQRRRIHLTREIRRTERSSSRGLQYYSVLALISFTFPFTRSPAAFTLPLARSAMAFTLFPLASST